MKAVSTSVMIVLVIAALFLGNCFTCPQVLMALAAHHSPHGCCHRHEPAQTGCQTQLLQHFVKAEAGTWTPAPAVTAMAPATALALLARPTVAPAVRPEPTPPDLIVLNASFRI